MPYPEQLDRFSAKLNKKTDGSMYVIEEELPLTDGKYEGLLAHDDIANSSIRVFTGSKLTGEEIVNYIISVPAETAWRRHIKVFSDTPVVYVTYASPGDTVEADDVNVLQESLTATQAEVERYKAANDEAVTQKVNAVQENLDAHAGNATDAHNVADRLETVRAALVNYIDRSVAAIVDGAPEMLDTLYELANALGNDPNFSATMTNLIGQKLNASEVVATPTANKVLRLDTNGKFSIGSMDIATQAEAETGTSNDKLMTPLRVRQAIAQNPLPSGLTWNNLKGV